MDTAPFRAFDWETREDVLYSFVPDKDCIKIILGLADEMREWEEEEEKKLAGIASRRKTLKKHYDDLTPEQFEILLRKIEIYRLSRDSRIRIDH